MAVCEIEQKSLRQDDLTHRLWEKKHCARIFLFDFGQSLNGVGILYKMMTTNFYQ